MGFWSRTASVAVLAAVSVVPSRIGWHEAHANAPPEPAGFSAAVDQGRMVHVFDTSTLPGKPTYVNDHTLIQASDGAWHLFGIFHEEPIGDDTEIDFIHAVAREPNPAKWEEGAFDAAPEPYTLALRADRSAGETHIWAPHVVAEGGRYFMVYQGGGRDDYHASIRVAESEDLYRWSRVRRVPLFEDICEARDPMLTRRDGAWVLYYTRCEAITRKVSGVAYRTSRDLVEWSEPRFALLLEGTPPTSNSAYTESPFLFERGGWYYLSMTSYPIAWDATVLYRSRTPYAFPEVPYTRLRSHAAEWIFRGNKAFMTHAGPGQRGVWVAPVEGF
jgi:hypothetical protein